MTVLAKVHNHAIQLPPEVVVADGTEVQVVVPEAASASTQPASFFDTVRDLIGSIKDGPEDLAAEHDHYAHGAPKRSARPPE